MFDIDPRHLEVAIGCLRQVIDDITWSFEDNTGAYSLGRGDSAAIFIEMDSTIGGDNALLGELGLRRIDGRISYSLQQASAITSELADFLYVLSGTMELMAPSGMSTSYVEKVGQFHNRLRELGVAPKNDPHLRVSLMMEEIAEIYGALGSSRTETYIRDKIAKMDQISDHFTVFYPSRWLINLVDYIAQLFVPALPVSWVFDAIHEANMRKLVEPVRFREDGKVLKPEGWKPADVTSVVARYYSGQ